jgi:hypothetical protein
VNNNDNDDDDDNDNNNNNNGKIMRRVCNNAERKQKRK